MKTVPDVQPVPWRDFCWDMPHGKVRHDEWIEVYRDSWLKPERIRLCDMAPQTNVAGLSWRRLSATA